MVYGYIRVSSDKQTVENQRFEINNFCEKQNLVINDWIEETISGTKNYTKRQLGNLLKKVHKDDIIICSELSRLGRNLFMIMEILNICMTKECRVWTIKDNYRLGDDIQSKVLAFAFGLSAEIERNLISQRTKEALARKKAEGVVLGRPKGKKSSPDKYKLSGKEVLIKELLKNTTVKREEILANCQTEDERKRTAELIRPILRGRDIKRYGYDWANLWLIATFPSRHYDIDKYPSIKQYLLSFGIERLEQTGKTHIVNGDKVKARKKTNNKWFETQDSISYWEDFNKPKVVYMEIQTDNPEEGYPFPCYSYDNKRCVVLNTAYIMSSETLDPRYVLGILNSRLGKFLVKLYVTQLQERQFRMLSQYVMKFPIARPTREQEKEMTHLVQDILVNKSIASENRIDELAFQIYKLSEQETKILISR